MRTTVRLPAELIVRAKARAARDNTTLTSLIEKGLRLVLQSPSLQRSERVLPRVSSVSGRQLLDTTKVGQLLEDLDDDLPLEKRR